MAKSDRRQRTEESFVRDQASDQTIMSGVQEPAHDDIARRAYSLYEARGGEPGHDLDDWLTAEAEIGQQRHR
jgi:hypothetical protein